MFYTRRSPDVPLIFSQREFPRASCDTRFRADPGIRKHRELHPVVFRNATREIPAASNYYARRIKGRNYVPTDLRADSQRQAAIYSDDLNKTERGETVRARSFREDARRTLARDRGDGAVAVSYGEGGKSSRVFFMTQEQTHFMLYESRPQNRFRVE